MKKKYSWAVQSAMVVVCWKTVKLKSSSRPSQSISTTTLTRKLPRKASSPSRLNLASENQSLRQRRNISPAERAIVAKSASIQPATEHHQRDGPAQLDQEADDEILAGHLAEEHHRRKIRQKLEWQQSQGKGHAGIVPQKLER